MPFYIWEAEHCLLDTVDADKFCRVMEGRKGLLFVGELSFLSARAGAGGGSVVWSLDIFFCRQP